jgi:hypothetical protein
MKNIIKIFVAISLLIFTLNDSFSQNISGTYRWELDEGRRYFEITLMPTNIILGSPITSYKGEHCGVFENGKRMDCSFEEYSINLNKLSENIFIGTILSAYSRTVHDIKVTYLPATNQIKWEVTNHRGGTTYFPWNVIMDK